MAISKTQNERPAIVALIDEANATSATVAQQQQQIYSNANAIAAEIETRTNAVDGLTRSLGATNQQVLLLTDEVEDLTDGLETEIATRQNWDSVLSQSVTDLTGRADAVDDSIETLQTWQTSADAFISSFKVGETGTITIPANDSYSSTYTFSEPFASTDDCIVILQVITSEVATLFETTLTGCTYSGFSYQITNSDAAAHDVKLGFVAVRTSSD